MRDSSLKLRVTTGDSFHSLNVGKSKELPVGQVFDGHVMEE